MRRLFVVALISVFLLLLSSGALVEAQAKSLYWKRFDVDVTVQPNGDLRVVETQEIAFLGGPFHYGFATIPGDRLDGITDVAESIFNLPTRLGRPSGISGLVDVVNNPMYATGVGLVLYGARMQPSKKFRIRDKNIFNGIMGRMKKWFKDVI